MFVFKRLFTAVTAAAAALSVLAFPAAADSSEVTAYLCYSGENTEIQSWEASDAAPLTEITGDGEYTVEFTSSQELPSVVTFLGVQFDNVLDQKIDVKAVKVLAGDSEVAVADSWANSYVAGGQQLKVIEDWDNNTAIDELEGQKKISVVFKVSGLGEAASGGGDSAAADNENLTTDDTAPTIAFDSDDWSDYIGVYDNTDSGSLSLKKETNVVYQGASVKLTAKVTEVPDYATDETTTLGVVFDAEKFGLENFDGYTLSVLVRFNTNVDGYIFDNKLSAFGIDENGEMTTTSVKAIVLDQLANVNSYEKQFIPIASGTNTKSVVIKVPISQAYEGDVIYLDNVTFISSLKDDSGASYQIKTMDTYNSNAKVTNSGDVIKQEQKQNTLKQEKIETSDKGGLSPVLIVVIAAVAVVIVVVVVVVIRHKNKFY